MTDKPTMDDRARKFGSFCLDMTPNKLRPEMNCSIWFYDQHYSHGNRLLFGECEVDDLEALCRFVREQGAKFANADREKLMADWPGDPVIDQMERAIASTQIPMPVSSSPSPLRAEYEGKAAAYFDRRTKAAGIMDVLDEFAEMLGVSDEWQAAKT